MGKPKIPSEMESTQGRYMQSAIHQLEILPYFDSNTYDTSTDQLNITFINRTSLAQVNLELT